MTFFNNLFRRSLKYDFAEPYTLFLAKKGMLEKAVKNNLKKTCYSYLL